MKPNNATLRLFDLTGRTALVTGGSRGLGLQMAEALGEMGAKVAISARKAGELAEAKAHLAALGIEAVTIVNDLQQFEQIPAFVEQAQAALGGRIDILVNNAGATWGAPSVDYPDEAWHKVMNLNVSAPFFLAREVARRAMIPAGGGKIINVASIAGLKATPGVVAYGSSKAAAISLTKSLAAEWGPHGINVNAICPGMFPSKMTAGTLEKQGEAIKARTPLRRLGSDEDLKGAVVYLASDAARHVTGLALVVDGGSSIL